jgi:hypothetical protein
MRREERPRHGRRRGKYSSYYSRDKSANTEDTDMPLEIEAPPKSLAKASSQSVLESVGSRSFKCGESLETAEVFVSSCGLSTMLKDVTDIESTS